MHAGGDGQGDRGPHLRVPDRPTPTRCAAWASFAIAAYLNVPVYAAFHEWLGRGDELAGRCGTRGRPATARRRSAAIPDERRRRADRPRLARASAASTSQRYVDNGVTTPALAILPFGLDARQAVRDLAPR